MIGNGSSWQQGYDSGYDKGRADGRVSGWHDGFAEGKNVGLQRASEIDGAGVRHAVSKAFQRGVGWGFLLGAGIFLALGLLAS